MHVKPCGKHNLAYAQSLGRLAVQNRLEGGLPPDQRRQLVQTFAAQPFGTPLALV